MSFTKVAPAGIGTSPGSTIRLGDSLLHSTGLDIGVGSGIGVTIRQHGDATFTGIITASAFFGDGSGLEGVSSSGIGTALNDDDTNVLNKIYYVNQELSIGSTVTVNHPDTGTASYTHYQDLVVKDDADFIVADGDTFIPDILGITTSTLAASAATGGRIRAGTITNAGANGAVNFPNGLTGTAGTFTGAISAASASITGNLGVGGVLTYEDVTNVDSVGVITARSGVNVSGGEVKVGAAVTVSSGGVITSGVVTATSFAGSGANLTGIVAVPSGCILIWSGAANAIPSGFVLCNGSNSTPDLRGKFVVGYHDGNNDYDVGDTGGAETVTLTTAQIPSHKHTTNIDGQHVIPGGGGSSYPYGGGGSYASRLFSMSNTGGGGAHENRPPFHALCYIMKT